MEVGSTEKGWNEIKAWDDILPYAMATIYIYTYIYYIYTIYIYINLIERVFNTT